MVPRLSPGCPGDHAALAKLLDLVLPTDKAKFVFFLSDGDRQNMPNIKQAPGYPWPYHEASRRGERRALKERRGK